MKIKDIPLDGWSMSDKGTLRKGQYRVYAYTRHTGYGKIHEFCVQCNLKGYKSVFKSTITEAIYHVEQILAKESADGNS